MARYDEDDAMTNMAPKAGESSRETNLRKGATSRESYSEQRLRKGAKPVAKAKPKAKPVVGRQGASSPAARAKTAPAKSPDQARARNAARPVQRANTGTPLRPTKPVGDRGMDARLTAKKAAVKPATKATTKKPRFGGFSIFADVATSGFGDKKRK